jgi:hypothetical protein
MDAADPCATCGAPLAPDQRYCLECGSRRPAIGSGPLGGSLSSGAGAGAGSGSGSGLTADGHSVRNDGAPAQAAVGDDVAATAVSATQRGGGPTAAIAGVGVLLLSMGVGVLIGRAGSDGAGKTSAPPAQVISVASSPGAATATSPTTSTPKSTVPAKASAHKTSKATSSPEVGQVPSKPAPPTVLEHLRGGSGQSYEQKSKNLPDVVSTG